MTWHTIEPRTRKYVEGYGLLSFARKYKKQLMDTGLDALKTAFEKVLYKTVEFLRNIISPLKWNDVSGMDSLLEAYG